ncbi:MAG TPA: hypothetical protein VNO53_10400 [Steroidobacteraceae bacterium]|nr:hypothetical protein [Steroidobacteraceae bacterium]
MATRIRPPCETEAPASALAGFTAAAVVLGSERLPDDEKQE